MNPFIENISFLPNQLRAIVQIFVNKRWHICHVTPLTADLELAFHQKYRPLAIPLSACTLRYLRDRK